MRTLDRAISVFEDRYAIVHPFQFESEQDIRAFAELTGQRLSRGTDSIWWPEVKLGRGNR